MGLIAREIEAAGLPTVSMTSAWDITEAVAPPRAVYFHAPLGHQTGPAGEPDTQRDLVARALEAGVSIEQPGEIRALDLRFPDATGWEATAYTPEAIPMSPDGKPNRGAPREPRA
ncbi:MAG: hypothetical protein QNK05_24120 [Myxococcota bacterium]|nr:hypothetical protein [Myxococcota bacterium]